MEQQLVQPVDQEKGHDDLIHLPGKHEGVALCGTKVRGLPASPSRPKCVVCIEFTHRAWHVR